MAGPGGPTVTRAQAVWSREHDLGGWAAGNQVILLQADPALRFQTRALPLAEPAWLASRGEGASQLRGFLNNTDVFDIICEQF
jgi:hypothetical protein